MLNFRFKPADPEDLLRAFQFLDPENHGYIMRADLENAMMEIGEPFTKEEIDEMMSVACDPSSNKINYEHYINLLIVSVKLVQIIPLLCVRVFPAQYPQGGQYLYYCRRNGGG